MKKHRRHELSRRQFLGQASCAAIGSTSLFSSLLSLRMASTAAAEALPLADPSDYKALVCLFLHGGNDSYNMLVPKGDTEYGDYQLARTDLAIPQTEILQLSPLNDLGGQVLGLNPAMNELRDLFDAQRLAFVSNVGTLVEPTTLEQYQNGTALKPRGLYSHRDQQQQWQTSVPDRSPGIGWGGRTADLLASMNESDRVSMNISLSGNNLWQRGGEALAYQIGKSGSVARSGYGGAPGSADAMVGAAIDNQLDHEYSNLFKETFVDITRNSIETHEEFQAAIGAVPEFTSQVYTDPLIDSAAEISAINNLAGYFTMVAKSIAAHETLGLRRQTFFVKYGGWDHHDDLLIKQAQMLKVVSRCLKYFDDLMQEIGFGEKVTLFTESEFSRTLTSNGDGSDHAWGGNHIVMGGAVHGGQVLGSYPELYPDSPSDVGRGRFIPTISVDEYFAELVQWFGVSSTDLDAVLPNIERFYSPGTGAPVGFLL